MFMLVAASKIKNFFFCTGISFYLFFSVDCQINIFIYLSIYKFINIIFLSKSLHQLLFMFITSSF
jgi:hypothetical protein